MKKEQTKKTPKPTKKPKTEKKATTKKTVIKKPQAVFEGRVVYSAKTLKEAILSGRAFQRNFYVVLVVLTIVEQIYFMIHTKSGEISLPIVSILICLYTIYNDFSKRNYERQVRVNGDKEVKQKVEFFEDKLVLTNEDYKTTVRFSYEDVNKIYETKHLFVLMLKYNTGITIEKESLKKDLKDLEDFIFSKTNLKKNKVKYVGIVHPYLFVGLLIVNIILLIIAIFLK